MGNQGGILGRIDELRALIETLRTAAESPQAQRRLRDASALLHAIEDAVGSALRAEATFSGGSGPMLDPAARVSSTT